MASEFAVLNPRRRRRRRAKTSAKRTRRRRRRTGTLAARALNPRRRRRRVTRTRARRRRGYRRNPRLLPAGINLPAIGFGAVGFVGSKVLGGWMAKMLPAEWTANPIAQVGVKAVAGIGAPMLAKQFKLIPAPMANAIMVGAGIAIAVDLFNAYLAPAMGLSDYQLDGYEGTPLLDTYQGGLVADGGMSGGDYSTIY